MTSSHTSPHTARGADEPNVTAVVPTRELVDADLIELCVARDERAWDTLVERHAPLVYSVARRAGLDASAAEDVMQATFLALFNEAASMRDGQSVAKWLIVVARRQAIRERNRRERAGTPSEMVDHTEVAPSEPEATSVESWERRAAVREAVRTLGGRCRELLSLLFLDASEPDYDAVAAQLSMPRGSIGPTRARCLAKLLAHVREQCPSLLDELGATEVSGERPKGT